jgi:hypothetical protein
VTLLLEIGAGFALGYLAGSLMESIWHQYIPDAPLWMRKLWNRYPRFSRLMRETHFYHHAIHHHRTYLANHVTQFGSPEERARLESFLQGRGELGRIIIRNNFANRLHTEALPIFCIPWLLAAMALALMLPLAAAVPASLMLILPGWFSYSMHPWLHLPFEEGQRLASLPMRLLLRSTYGRAVYRTHFIHHRHGGVSNFNLVLGADHLRGLMRRVDAADVAEMRAVGLPVD